MHRHSPDMWYDKFFMGTSDRDLISEIKKRGYVVVQAGNVAHADSAVSVQVRDISWPGITQHIRMQTARRLGFAISEQERYVRFATEMDDREQYMPMVIYRASVNIFNPLKTE